MRIQDDAPLTLICITHGSAVIVTDSGESFDVGPGDVAVARGIEHYSFADQATTEPQVVIHPGNRCTTLRGEDLRFEMSVGVRTWGNASAGADRAVICAYEGRSEVSSRLLHALPTVVVLRGDKWRTPLVPLLTAEAGRDGPGQAAYLDRLLDLLLMDVLRTWFDRDEQAPAWWHADHDPLVGPALRLIYHNPERPWTVANLAAAVGSSRAVFARRFVEQVGEPPIAFLTGWRLALAADLTALGLGDHRGGRPRRRLQHSVRLEQRLQTRVRRQPEPLPLPPQADVSRSTTPATVVTPIADGEWHRGSRPTARRAQQLQFGTERRRRDRDAELRSGHGPERQRLSEHPSRGSAPRRPRAPVPPRAR